MEATGAPIITFVRDTKTIGALVRARRKAARMTQAQAAGLAGVGNRFLSELERGKRTLELGLVLQVLERLGFELAIAPRGASPFARVAHENSLRQGAEDAAQQRSSEGRVGKKRRPMKGIEPVPTKAPAKRAERPTRARVKKRPKRGRRGG